MTVEGKSSRGRLSGLQGCLSLFYALIPLGEDETGKKNFSKFCRADQIRDQLTSVKTIKAII